MSAGCLLADSDPTPRRDAGQEQHDPGDAARPRHRRRHALARTGPLRNRCFRSRAASPSWRHFRRAEGAICRAWRSCGPIPAIKPFHPKHEGAGLRGIPAIIASRLMATIHLLIGAVVQGSDAVLVCIQLLIHRLTTAKKSPVESPHISIPVNASSGASIRHGLGNTRSP